MSAAELIRFDYAEVRLGLLLADGLSSVIRLADWTWQVRDHKAPPLCNWAKKIRVWHAHRDSELANCVDNWTTEKTHSRQQTEDTTIMLLQHIHNMLITLCENIYFKMQTSNHHYSATVRFTNVDIVLVCMIIYWFLIARPKQTRPDQTSPARPDRRVQNRMTRYQE